MIYIKECHICHSTDIADVTTYGDKFAGETVRQCMNCGLAFLSPRMSNEELEEYYLSDSFSLDFRKQKTVDEEKDKHLTVRAQKRWSALEPFFDENSKFLEIGCSSGHFLLQSINKTPYSYGVDPSTGYAEHINSLSVWAEKSIGEVRVGHFPEESFEDLVNKFDIIGIFHTLEHVPNPRYILQQIHNRLNEGGLLVLEYPDLELVSQRAVLHSNYFQRSHLYDFSGSNLANLLSETGFAVTVVGTPNEDYPADKNVLVVCEKSTPADTRYYDQERVKNLHNTILERIVEHVPVNINLGRRPIIVHIASHNINVGDGAISAGIHGVASAILGTEVNFIAMDIVDYIGSPTPEAINSKKPDLVIIGGGGTIDGHKSRTKSGTAFQMSPSELSEINAPITFVGLGHNVFRDQEVYNMDVLEDFILYLKSENIPFSVRKDGSKKRLSSVLSASVIEHIQEVPDPGFFVPVGAKLNDGKRIPHISPLAKNVIIFQIAGDVLDNRIGKDHEEFFEHTKDLLKELVNFDSQTYVVMPIHTYADLYPQLYISANMHPFFKRVKLSSTGIYHPMFARQFFKVYAQASVVIGMRGHSVICGAGLDRPTIAISTHDKVSGFMQEIGAEKWIVEPDSNMKDNVLTLMNELLNDPDEQLNIVRDRTRLWKRELLEFLADSVRKI